VGAGDEINWLAEANGAVLVTLWEEATEEHGDDVFWVVAARVDQIYKVKMADLQGHLQEILSRSSYVQLLVHDVM
jgi:hypothetical protein